MKRVNKIDENTKLVKTLLSIFLKGQQKKTRFAFSCSAATKEDEKTKSSRIWVCPRWFKNWFLREFSFLNQESELLDQENGED